MVKVISNGSPANMAELGRKGVVKRRCSRKVHEQRKRTKRRGRGREIVIHMSTKFDSRVKGGGRAASGLIQRE